MSAAGSRLVARDLWAGYGGAPVLAGVDLTLEPGSAIGIIGRSGVGKTTLAQAMLGHVKPTQGRVTFNERTVSRMSRKDTKAFRAVVRAVHQDGLGGVDPRTTVERVLNGALQDARKAGRATGQDVPEVLALSGLGEHYAARTFTSLSGGERQRVALAHALATRPDLLVLDEPATALDPALRDQVTERVAALVASGVGLLVVSHDLRMVDRLTTTVHVLAEGTLVESGPLRDVLGDPQHPDTRALAEALPDAVGTFR